MALMLRAKSTFLVLDAGATDRKYCIQKAGTGINVLAFFICRDYRCVLCEIRKQLYFFRCNMPGWIEGMVDDRYNQRRDVW